MKTVEMLEPLRSRVSYRHWYSFVETPVVTSRRVGIPGEKGIAGCNPKKPGCVGYSRLLTMILQW